MSDVLKQLSTDLANVTEIAGASIVRIEARKRLPASGIVWSADGVIVTSHHVIEHEDNITIGLPDGNTTTATLVGRDPSTDLAVLRATASSLTAATWIEASDLAVGHLVLALGRPGRTVQATLGIVSALGGSWRTPTGGQIEHYLQTDVTMYPGFSGGPLVGVEGKIAGVNSSALLRGVSITVPTGTVRSVVETLLSHGRMPRGYLGVSIQPVRLPDALQTTIGQETGLMVMGVEAGEPAATAGVLQGDIVVALDGQPVRHADDLQTLLTGERVGKAVALKLVRGGQVQEVSVMVGQK